MWSSASSITNSSEHLRRDLLLNSGEKTISSLFRLKDSVLVFEEDSIMLWMNMVFSSSCISRSFWMFSFLWERLCRSKEPMFDELVFFLIWSSSSSLLSRLGRTVGRLFNQTAASMLKLFCGLVQKASQKPIPFCSPAHPRQAPVLRPPFLNSACIWKPDPRFCPLHEIMVRCRDARVFQLLVDSARVQSSSCFFRC